MGQYYNAVILKENKKTVKSFMYPHDYENGAKLMEHSWVGNNFVDTFESLIKDNPQRVVWAGDYADECKGHKTNVCSRCKDKLKVNPSEKMATKFVINYTKKVYVDKDNIPAVNGWKIHPLPLLTCEGNGRGGGDFREDEKGLVGSWARDLVSVSNTIPNGFKEILFHLQEN